MACPDAPPNQSLFAISGNHHPTSTGLTTSPDAAFVKAAMQYEFVQAWSYFCLTPIKPKVSPAT
jgi:hypothetical protein